MPFSKIAKNKYESPSGRKYNLNQIRAYYAGGGHFPGAKAMKDQFPKNHNSPTAPGAAAKPSFIKSGREDATSSTPSSILRGGKQTFGPLEYSTRDKDQEYWAPEQMADRERRRASKEYNRRNK